LLGGRTIETKPMSQSPLILGGRAVAEHLRYRISGILRHRKSKDAGHRENGGSLRQPAESEGRHGGLF
jgi:hypothetical protein